MKYNGWKNYETWATYFWLTKDENKYSYWKAIRADVNRQQLAERLKDTFKIAVPLETGLYADLLGNALNEVDWSAIAGELLGE